MVVLSAFRMAQDHITHTEFAKHRSRNFTGKGALFGGVHGLRSEGDDTVATECFVSRRQRGERRANNNIGVGHAIDPLDDVFDQSAGIRGGAVHLPISGDEWTPRGSWFRCTHGRSWRAATPGRVLPSRNSREAPPPVEIKVTWLATPAFLTALTESPPPIMETAF